MTPRPPPLQAFCFVLACLQPSLGGFPGQRSSRQLLQPCSLVTAPPLSNPGALQAAAAAAAAAARCSSMELRGASLLLCLVSLLTQVTAEAPSPKVKKAANGKKGKAGDGAPRHLPGSWSPSPLLGPQANFPSG